MVDFLIAAIAVVVVAWSFIRKFKMQKKDGFMSSCGFGCNFCNENCAQRKATK